MIKAGIRTITRNHLDYIVEKGKVTRSRPWLADAFSCLYDFVMKRFIFPRKFGANITKHYDILREELKDIHGKRVLELATGSGSAVNFLPNDIQYTGTDISPGLLKIATRNFRKAGFKDVKFYVTSADTLPFCDNVFAICLCILSLNFFGDVRKVLREIGRVLVPGGVFICSVPVPERNILQSKIQGRLFSETELAQMCREHGFKFESNPVENGILLYFSAILQ
jgi:SAM-dependent methyltransferase